jgi:hypothetical protein
MSTQSVVEARALLAAAEAAQRDAHRAELIEQLRKVRAALLSESHNLEQMSQKVMKAQADLDNTRNQILVVVEAIGISAQQRPAIVEYLPGDPEAVAWSSKHSALEQEHARLLAVRRALPDVERMRIDGVNLAKRVQELMYAESSLLHQLDGSLAQWPVGGTFGLT